MTQKRFNPKLILPENKRLILAGAHLHRIGLTKMKLIEKVDGKMPKMKRINVRFKKFIFLLFGFRSLASLLLINHNDNNLIIYMGDFTAFIPGVQAHVNFSIIVFVFLSLILHFIYWRMERHQNKRECRWTDPFRVMCGLWPPSKIRFFNEKDVNKLLKATKLIFIVVWFFGYENNYYIIITLH